MKRGNYEQPLKVEGSFMDLMNATVKDADKKSAPKKNKRT